MGTKRRHLVKCGYGGVPQQHDLHFPNHIRKGPRRCGYEYCNRNQFDTATNSVIYSPLFVTVELQNYEQKHDFILLQNE